MVLNEVENLLSELEKAELEAATGALPAQTYTQLLALYLHENDLCNAKFLWKRIPTNIKTSTPELLKIWQVGQKMWKRDWSAVHAALNCEWSEDVRNIMNALKENVRERAMSLISEAYSSVELSAVSLMTGLTAEEARSAVLDRGWGLEDTTVKPRKCDREQSNATNASLTEDQLYKLTQFVSFLEN
ncbi:COP9 signalosome complex subunit 8 [Venturia canescens]|uniref:COP9 signalosome complex subunit 8 n=1 Tax=Venturia canescens TaxID=32260 RepID=UPI001C9C3794|nr:COP9 signalosome complex subunit 8 [Venturia canescens]